MALRAAMAAGVVLAGLAAAADPAQARSPQTNYVLHCQGCHLPDGSGMPGRVPPMKGAVAKFLAVPDGRAFLVQVPGVAKSRLSDAETAALMNWMLAALDPAHVPPDFEPYSAEEVGRLRADPETAVLDRRAALVAAIEELAEDQ